MEMVWTFNAGEDYNTILYLHIDFVFIFQYFIGKYTLNFWSLFMIFDYAKHVWAY